MRNSVRVVVGVAAMLAVLVTSVGVADARWSRGFSDIDAYANDESICEDAWKLSASLEDKRMYDAGFPPPTLGDVRQTTLRLYASAADAEFFLPDLSGFPGQNPIIEILIDQVFVELQPGAGPGGIDRRIWYGEATVTPPPGYPNGSVIYAQGLGPSVSDTVAVPLTVGGEARYGCAPEPAPLEFTFRSPKNRLYLRARFPQVITFKSANVDLASIKIGTDDTVAQPALASWSWRGTGVALFSPRRLGATCAATKLTLTAKTLDGSPLAGSVNVTPVGGCTSG